MAPTDKVMAEQRAASFTRRSLKGATKPAGLRLALSMVDLTTLEGKDTPEKVRSLCRKAVFPGDAVVQAQGSPERKLGAKDATGQGVTDDDLPPVAAVCVYPTMVSVARKELAKFGERGAMVKIAAVATGFPSGQYPLKVRLDDVRRAVDAGAHEIDMVISRGAFLAGNEKQVYDEISATVEACGFKPEIQRGARGDSRRKAETRGIGTSNGASASLRGSPRSPRFNSENCAHLKVILETGELETLDNVRRASVLAIRAMHDTGLAAIPGAAFIKTSTGKVEPAATMPVTLIMLEAIRDHWLATGELVGMKPAGGIRTAKQALHYLVMLKETLGSIPDEQGAGGRPGAYLSPRLFRFGASALVNDLLRQIAWVERRQYMARYDFAEA